MNENNDITMLEAVERYIRGEMNPDERLHFENLRKSNGEIDQLVVEHTLFLQQMNRFGEWQKFRNTLQDVHTDLAQTGKISADKLKGQAKVIYLWNRYKRVAAIAAFIACITALTFSSVIWSISPKTPTDQIEKLDRKFLVQDKKTNDLKKELDNLKTNVNNVSKKAEIHEFDAKIGGTGFLIEGRGLMITNAHVVQNSRNIKVVNLKGEEFNAFVVKLDVNRDVAIIKIDDTRFKSRSSLPYGIRKTSSKMAEHIFTLGFPREAIVYGEGYLSAETGFEGDTLSFQIAVPANPGNSGGPIFNHDGEVIGILSARETNAQGAVFAVQSKYIYQALEELKKNSLYQGIKLSSKSSVAGLDKEQQVEKIQDCIFIVKGD